MCMRNVQGVVKKSKITFSNVLIVIMGLLHVRKKFQFQIFSWVLRQLIIWKILTKGKIQVARNYVMWVFKRTAFKPRLLRNNRKKDLIWLDQKIIQKLFKSVHQNIMTKEQFLDDFSVWWPRVFILDCRAVTLVSFVYSYQVLSSKLCNTKFHHYLPVKLIHK